MLLERRNVYAHLRIGLTTAVGLLLMFVVVVFLLGTEEVIETIKPRIPLVFIRLLLGIFLFSLLASWSISILEKWSIKRDSWKYWGFQIAVIIVSVTVVSTIEANIEIPHPEEFKAQIKNRGTAIVLVNCSISILVFMIYQMWTVIEDNQSLQLSLSSAEKDKMALQLATLQQKVNPHFLFNSLNVLSELIYEDLDKANEFIHQFSKIYRYVLEMNNESFVPIKKEVQFLESYLFLQKIRFGDKLKVDINLSDEILATYVPPLAFQTIVENAVKHNEVSKEFPLHIKIYSSEDKLIFENNLNPLRRKLPSTGMGQKNLSSTYSLLSDHVPTFSKEEQKYIVELPILRNFQ